MDERLRGPVARPPDEGGMDIGLRLLDQQLMDREGRYCGRVDDIELEGPPGGPVRIVRLLVGVEAARPRLPWLLRRLSRVTRGVGDAPLIGIAWTEVAEVSHVVRLRRTAEELGLAAGDRRLARIVGRLPGA